MGRTCQQNFERRFGNPPRINITFVPLDSLSPSEASHRKEGIFEAYVGALKCLLGRQPTQNEIFGRESIEGKIVLKGGEKTGELQVGNGAVPLI